MNYFGKSQQSHAHRDQDFELNLASIIDCFTVLITFMLASASFISIGIMDAGVVAAGDTASAPKPADISVIIELKRNLALDVRVAGKLGRSRRLASLDGQQRDLGGLSDELGSLKRDWPSLDSATLIAENSVQYREVIEAMDKIRKILPAVMLGGF